MITSDTGLLVQEYEEKLDDNGRLYLEVIRTGAFRMKEMIDSLLYYARIGHHSRPFERVDTGEVIEEVQRSMKLTLEESGAELIVSRLPEVSGDRIELTRVFQNLLSNALKFRSDAKPEVRISSERMGDRFRFTVADNGIGIDAKHFTRIFEVFQRLHPHDRYQGTGIGLSECRKIVERHGGQIWLESLPGRGTKFHFTLLGCA